MISLTEQIVNGLKETFKARNDEYKKTIIKEVYQPMPKGEYPKIIVEEIDNEEIASRTTGKGERTTLLTYQITCYSRDMKQHNYIDSAKFLATLVDDYIAENYQMQRLGYTHNLKPYIFDQTVMTCVLRYSCVYDKETDLIYRYYNNFKNYRY